MISILFFTENLFSQNKEISFNNEFTKSQIFYLKKDYSSALKHIDKCLKIKPNSSTAYFLKAKIYNSTNDYFNSLSSINTAIELDHDNLDYLRFLFIIQKKNNHYKEANSTLNKILENSNNYFDFINALDYFQSISYIPDLLKTTILAEQKFGKTQNFDYILLNIYSKTDTLKSIQVAKRILKKFNFDTKTYFYIIKYYENHDEFDSIILFNNNIKNINGSLNRNLFTSVAYFKKFNSNHDSSYLDTALNLFLTSYKKDNQNNVFYFLKNYDFFINPLYLNNYYDSVISYILTDKNFTDFKTIYNQYSLYNRYCNEIYLLELQTAKTYNYYAALELSSLYLRFSKWAKLDSLASSYLKLYPDNSRFYLFKAIALLNSDSSSESIDYLNTGRNFLFGDSLYTSYYNFFTALYYQTQNDTDSYEYYRANALEYGKSDCSVIIFYSLYLAQTNTNKRFALKIISDCVMHSPDDLPTYLAYVYSYVLFINSDYKNALIYINLSISSTKYPNFIYFYLKYQILLKLNNPNASYYYELSKKYGNLCL